MHLEIEVELMEGFSPFELPADLCDLLPEGMRSPLAREARLDTVSPFPMTVVTLIVGWAVLTPVANS